MYRSLKIISNTRNTTQGEKKLPQSVFSPRAKTQSTSFPLDNENPLRNAFHLEALAKLIEEFFNFYSTSKSSLGIDGGRAKKGLVTITRTATDTTLNSSPFNAQDGNTHRTKLAK